MDILTVLWASFMLTSVPLLLLTVLNPHTNTVNTVFLFFSSKLNTGSVYFDEVTQYLSDIVWYKGCYKRIRQNKLNRNTVYVWYTILCFFVITRLLLTMLFYLCAVLIKGKTDHIC